ncbi:MAG TPA: hypothetical protein VJ914_02120 [Pseudonocardiaceae bacterium]|nr:hypothetical protein [Pseudonocardiaceae bacterium]
MTTLSPRRVPNSRIERRQRWWAMVVLAVLAPFTVDVLFGATTITAAIGVLAEIPGYGFAALLIRGVARRRGRGFRAVVLLGIAYALTAEFLIVQTSLAPLGPLQAYPGYGRAAGVNWPYLVWALGYESLWGVAMPIQLTELIFPLHRTSAWLGARGSAVLTILFVLGAGAFWYNWTQIVVPKYLHLPVYLPPLITVLCGWCVVLVLVLAALLLRPAQRGRAATDSGPAAPAPIAMGIVAAGGTFLWFALTVLWPSWGGWVRAIPAFVPILLALILAALACVACRAWVGRAGWSDRHRLAVVSGALLSSMAVGFVVNDLSDPVNLIGKIVLNVAAAASLVLLAAKLRRRGASAAE